MARFPIADDVILFRSGEGIKAVIDQRAVVVLSLLDGDHTVAQVVDELADVYEGADRATIEADVLSMLAELDDEDLLEVTTP